MCKISTPWDAFQDKDGLVVLLGPVLYRVDVNRNIFAIDIDCNYVHEEIVNCKLAIDLDHSQLFIRWGPRSAKYCTLGQLQNVMLHHNGVYGDIE